MRSLFSVLAILMFVASVGCNGTTETPPATGGDKTPAAEEKKDESASTTPATGDFQEVSLTLPKMT